MNVVVVDSSRHGTRDNHVAAGSHHYPLTGFRSATQRFCSRSEQRLYEDGRASVSPVVLRRTRPDLNSCMCTEPTRLAPRPNHRQVWR